MTLKVKYMRSFAAGTIPTPSQILEGQLFINFADKIIYTKNDSGAVVTLANYKQSADVWGSEFLETTITATAGQTALVAPYVVGLQEVYLNGKLVSQTAYTATDGLNLKLSTGAAAGDIISVISYTEAANYYRQEFTALSSGSSTFTVTRPYYDKKYASVYVNGVRKLDADITYDGINKFTLTTAASDVVIFTCFNPFELTTWTLTGTYATNDTRYFNGTLYYAQSPIASGVPFVIAQNTANSWYPLPVSGGPSVDPFVADVVVSIAPIMAPDIENGVWVTTPVKGIAGSSGNAYITKSLTQSGFGSLNFNYEAFQTLQAADTTRTTIGQGMQMCKPNHWNWSDASTGFVTFEWWMYPARSFTGIQQILFSGPSTKTIISNANVNSNVSPFLFGAISINGKLCWNGTTLNTWTHFAAVFDVTNKTVTTYRNGVTEKTNVALDADFFKYPFTHIGSAGSVGGVVPNINLEGIRITLNKRYAASGFTPTTTYNTYNAAYEYPKDSHYISDGVAYFATEDIPANAPYDSAKWSTTYPKNTEPFIDSLMFAGFSDGASQGQVYNIGLIWKPGSTVSVTGGGTLLSMWPSNSIYANNSLGNQWEFTAKILPLPSIVVATSGSITVECYLQVSLSSIRSYAHLQGVTTPVIVNTLRDGVGDWSYSLGFVAHTDSISADGLNVSQTYVTLGMVMNGALDSTIQYDVKYTTSAGAKANLGDWIGHVALQWNGQDVSLWVDGKKVASKTDPSRGSLCYNQVGSTFKIGTTGSGNDFFSSQFNITQLRITGAAKYTGTKFYPWYVSLKAITTWKLANTYVKGASVYYEGVMYYAQSAMPANTPFVVGIGNLQWSQTPPVVPDSFKDFVVMYAPLADGDFSSSYPVDNMLSPRGGNQLTSYKGTKTYVGFSSTKFSSSLAWYLQSNPHQGHSVQWDASKDFTVEARVWLAQSTGGFQSFIELQHPSGEIILTFNGTQLVLYSSGFIISGPNITPGDFANHIALVRSSAAGNTILILNGAIVGTTTAYNGWTSGTFKLRCLGTDHYPSNSSYVEMREFRISTAARYSSGTTLVPDGATFDTIDNTVSIAVGDTFFLGGKKYYASYDIKNGARMNTARTWRYTPSINIDSNFNTVSPYSAPFNTELVFILYPHTEWSAGFCDISIPLGTRATVAVDASGDNGMPYAQNNLPPQTVSPRYGLYALYLTGIGNPIYTNIPDSDAGFAKLNTNLGFTFEYWCNTSYSGLQVIGSHLSNYYLGVPLINNGKSGMYINGSFYYGSDSGTLADGQWHHVAHVISGNNCYTFIDGVKQTSTYGIADFPVIQKIGFSDANSDTRFRGYLQQIVLTNRAKYSANFTPYDLGNETFTEAAAYSKGSYVQRDGVAYVANTDTTSTAWNPSQWTADPYVDIAADNLSGVLCPGTLNVQSYNRGATKVVTSGGSLDATKQLFGLSSMRVTGPVVFADATSVWNTSSFNSVAISMWVYSSGNGTICTATSYGTKELKLIVSGTTLTLSDGTTNLSGSITANTWTHVVITRQQTKFFFSIGGKLISGYINFGKGIAPNMNMPVMAPDGWQGNVFDVRFYAATGSAYKGGYDVPNKGLNNFMRGRGYDKNETTVISGVLMYRNTTPDPSGTFYQASNWSTTLVP